MATTEVTKDNLHDIIEGEGIVLLDFWAAWCGPCRAFGPVFEQAALDNEDIVFGKVDTEAERELAAGLQITSIPTLMAFRDGILVYDQAGALRRARLDQLISAVRELDMGEVRAQVEEATRTQAPTR